LPTGVGDRVITPERFTSNLDFESAPGKRTLLFAQPLRSEAGVACAGATAEKMVLIVGYIEPPIWEAAGLTEEEVFARAQANVAEAGLQTATDIHLSSVCPEDEPETCADGMPPSAEP
jgi:hypothetical protein